MTEQDAPERRSVGAEPFVDPTFEADQADSAAARRALFLDRDGVINVDHGYVHRPEETQFIDGIFDLCRAATLSGYLLIVVTNQAGIGRGYYSQTDFLDYMSWVHAQFRDRGALLSATYYCPHHPTEAMAPYRVACECRKPKPGMLLAAERRFKIDMPGSIFIGDTVNDMLAGEAAGVGQRLLLGDQDGSVGRNVPTGAARLQTLNEVMLYGV